MGTASIRVLHVDDDPGLVDLTGEFLKREDDRFSLETATGADEGLDQIADRPPDCIVSDYDMPGQNGIEFLRSVRDEWPDLPFILFTGKGSEEVAGDAISNGATDYLQKTNGTDQYRLLANRIKNAVSQYQSEKRLKQTKEEYATVFEGALNGLLLVDVQGDEFHYRRCNPRAAELIGHDQADIVGHTPCEALGPENGKKVRGAYRTCVEQREPVEYTVELDLPVGQTIRPGKVTPVKSNGEIEELVVSFYDATDEERQQERFRALVEKSKDSLSILDTDGRFQYQSPSIKHILGYDSDEPIGDLALEYIHPDDREDARNWFERLGAGKGTDPIEYRARHADGSWRWMEAHGSNQLDNPAVEGLVTNSRDITARKERQRELEELTSQYEDLIENFPNGGVFLFDEDLRYVRAGGEGLDEVGLSSAELKGKTPHDLFSDDIADEHAEYFKRTLAGERHTYRQKYQGLHYEIRTVPVRDDTGTVAYGMAVSDNIAQQVEQKRQLKQQNERLEEFASVVSHDLRNPLQVAVGRLELAQEECDSAHIGDVADALDRSQALIDDLLTLARGGDTVGSMETVLVSAQAKECWEVIPGSDATLDIKSDQTVTADRSRLQQLLENLLANAVEHGGPGVTVSIGGIADGFYIADDGVGIPERERASVFDAGYSTAEDGTGFGLRIVEQIVDAHGWAIEVVESQSGGARFEITEASISE